MNTAIKFDRTTIKPLRPVTNSKEREATWEKTMKLFEQGQYKDCVLAVIDYANPIVRTKFGNPEQTKFIVAHGSAVVTVEIENNTFKVTAPFLRLPENKIPLLRRINEINFGVLSLPQIYLKGEELFFHYECALEMCYPYKVYDILREICSNADFFDDEFVMQFGAKRIMEPNVIPFESNQKEKAWEKFKEYLQEASEYIQYMESKRMDGFIWDILSIELRKIEYFVAPQGKLRNDIESAVKELGNGNLNFNERLNTGKKFIAQLQAVTKEAFMEDLYLTDVFIPYKFYTRVENIKENFNNTLERAGKEMNGGDYISSTFTMQYDLLNLFYNYDLTPDIADFAERTLAAASGKEWKEAAGEMYNSLQSFVKDAALQSTMVK
jgi:hypothetical protein